MADPAEYPPLHDLMAKIGHEFGNPRLLEEAMFLPQASARAVYAPPINWGIISAAGDAWERMGRFAWSGFGGVLMIEAMKRLYIEPGTPARGRRVVKVAPQKRSLRAPVDKIRE